MEIIQKRIWVFVVLLAITLGFSCNNVAAAPKAKGAISVDFANGDSALCEKSDWTNGSMFNCTWRPKCDTFKDGKMILSIDKETEKGDYPYIGGEYRTIDKRFGFGKYEVTMKAIKNDGVVSSFFTYCGPYEGDPWDEIDIEFLGKDTTKVQFNYYTDGKGNHEKLYDLGFDASKEFHTYGFEWHNDRITWFVDGKAVYTAKDNTPSHPGRIMMNVWPGKGVDSWLKPFNDKNLPLHAEYKSFSYTPYNEKVLPRVAAPKKFRAPTVDGNLIYGCDFKNPSDISGDTTDSKNWTFLLAEGGDGSASISDGVLTINTKKPGKVDYSVQLVQPHIPMVKGKKYRLTFDAQSDAKRTMIVAITAPDENWARYLADTTLTTTKDWKTYTYNFTMNAKDDDNGRFEFNMGNKGSTATIRVKNIRLEMLN